LIDNTIYEPFVILNPATWYRALSFQMLKLSESKMFQNFLTLVIIAAGVSVGMATDRHLSVHWERQLKVLDIVIQNVFISEAAIKIISEEYRPWRYFNDNWNKFDFFVVSASFLDIVMANMSANSLKVIRVGP